MDWIIGIQKAIDYIEDHLLEEIDYETVAAQSYSSNYHFQRVFSILCGFTLGEYIRNRRLTLAGNELATSDIKVIDAALKYGYESPDSFSKAFQKFHGILPSQARQKGNNLKSFSRLVLKISAEGGRSVNYRIEEKEELVLTGYKAHFTGAPYGEEREWQEEQLFITTRGKQWFLSGASGGGDSHCVITNVSDEGYDFYLCYELDEWTRKSLYNKSITGVDFVGGLGLETISIPGATYVIFETSDVKKTIAGYVDLLRERPHVLNEWLPEMGLQLKKAPELAVYHWKPRHERNVQIWLPVEKA